MSPAARAVIAEVFENGGKWDEVWASLSSSERRAVYQLAKYKIEKVKELASAWLAARGGPVGAVIGGVKEMYKGIFKDYSDKKEKAEKKLNDDKK